MFNQCHVRRRKNEFPSFYFSEKKNGETRIEYFSEHSNSIKRYKVNEIDSCDEQRMRHFDTHDRLSTQRQPI